MKISMKTVVTLYMTALGKEKISKEQSFEATAIFGYIWDNSWLGYGGEMSMTAFGSTEQEALERLKDELFTYQSEFVKALSNLTPHTKL